MLIKVLRSQENLDSILKAPFKLNEHQSYNAASHLVERGHMSACRLYWTVRWNFTVCNKCPGGVGLNALRLPGQRIHFTALLLRRSALFWLPLNNFKMSEKKTHKQQKPELREIPETIGKCFHSRLILSTEVRERTADKNPLYGKTGIRTREGKCVILCG